MPHLAPMFWLSIALIFWAGFSLLMTSFWWSQAPTFPPLASNLTPPPSRSWPWA